MGAESPPWSAALLTEWLESIGPEGVQRRLGAFVLVGSDFQPDEEGSGWSFTTGVRSPKEAAGNEMRLDLSEAVVYPITKRSSTFFPTTILVGRASSNDVVLDHPSISKLHARLRPTKNGFWVEDAGSQNGSGIDGQPIREPVVAEAGDWLRFGELHFLVLEAETLTNQLVSTARG